MFHLKKTKTILFIVLSSTFAFAQSQDAIYTYKNNPNDKASQTILRVAKKYVGTPYLAGTLEQPKETLVCRTDAFDCFTFVEHCVALTRNAHSAKPSFENYQKMLAELRYHQGMIDGYGSRLHYFSGWILQANQKGIVRDVLKDTGKPLEKKIQFMTTHKGLYPMNIPIKEWNKIKVQESVLSQASFFYLLKDSIEANQNLIQSGDIIAFTSTIDGLDVNHEGIAVWVDNTLRFVHASSENKKVELSNETISGYTNRIKKHAGIFVYRLL